MKNKLLYILPSLIVGVVIGIAVIRYYDVYKVHDAKPINNNSEYSIEELKRKVWVTEDINSYRKLQGAYREMSSENFLFWAMYMANKYDYSKAYEDVYYSIEEKYPPDSAIFNMDEKTRTFALHYLKLAAQKNDTSALDKIKELKAMKIPPSWVQ